MPEPGLRGVFAGLATLDVIHRVGSQPGPNEKITALAQFVAAGGPAANAAVTFAALGGTAQLITVLGQGQVARTIAEELAGVGVEVIDIAPELRDAAPISSVAVLEETGERSVIGGDATGVRVRTPDAELLGPVLDGADVILLDGHHPALARAVVAAATQRGTPTVLDAGRWKPVMEDLVGSITDVVASADFRTPGTTTSQATAEVLRRLGASSVVTTAGPDPVRWTDADGNGLIDVPRVAAVDTLAAGDVFHGAYAYALAAGAGIEQRIRYASAVAALRTSMVGPRSWLGAIAEVPWEGPER